MHSKLSSKTKTSKKISHILGHSAFRFDRVSSKNLNPLRYSDLINGNLEFSLTTCHLVTWEILVFFGGENVSFSISHSKLFLVSQQEL